MCMALLGRIVALEPEGAVVDIRGRRWPVETLLVPDVSIGDDVLVTSGLIVARLSPEEAEMRRQMFDHLFSPDDGTTPS
jgi:hydrogenase maturation factor